MSYCRWSTDDFQCDLYVYEHVGGFFAIHVAGNRVVYKEPLPAPVSFDLEHIEEWTARNRVIMDMLNDETRHERVPINLPHAGETFKEPSAAEAAERVEQLIALGYKCPASVVSELREEAAAS